MQLYSYFRSSASFRVRIALNLKGLGYDYLPVHLVRGGGEQLSADYRRVNPDALVPTLVDDEVVMQQSLAIIEYLEERHATPPLLPPEPAARAHVRGLALQIACEIHPLNNLRVLRYLKGVLQISDEAQRAWYRHWIEAGFETFELRLTNDPRTGAFCYGDKPTVADIALVPQVFNAHRFEIDTSRYPTLHRIYQHSMELPAFIDASPGRQPDAE
ncbi:maleylacetoacetate isomerase [Burkholderia sp. USMB20]|uniref:maleylacetoacetate isomerase n=1 Tax=Burkholderia sp. USMB20 TaxID=1571773 RepID=UPI0005CEDE89|nr:maleylacetoacetate isomerase [Burkholderia sp. USMB20]TGN99184.1 maleylacetoacetate isomerase [Burkholderia sp. USMB20]